MKTKNLAVEVMFPCDSLRVKEVRHISAILKEEAVGY